MKNLLAVVSLSVVVAGCGESPMIVSSTTPFAPTPNNSPERWMLAVTHISVTGPQCLADRWTGTTIYYDLRVSRSAEALWLGGSPWDDASDGFEYRGSLSENEFELTSRPGWGKGLISFAGCGKLEVGGVESSVSGRLSDDGRALSAEGVWSYLLSTGERIEIRSRWAADAV